MVCINKLAEPAVNFFNYGINAGQVGFNEVYGPFFQRLAHNGVVGVG